ncbi:lipopolysaccharide biosynthesis protein [Candidatus Woesearchaeota archaeon]|nr:lipopolysaccharide biosynthesis protein [Candidatus Woesearchaeota archaeon]
MYELKKKAFLGVLWGSGNYIFQQVVLLIVKLILVRLLIPEEFGIAAMAWILISSLSLINAFGTGAAFIRDNKSEPKKAKNTLFYLDAAALVLIAVFGFILSPYVAGFFGKKISNPQTIVHLTWMIRLLALSQLFQILTIIPGRVLAKELRFKEGVISNLVGALAYGILAPVLAYFGFGAWSIVIAQLSNNLVSTIIRFSYSPFIPSLIFDKNIAKDYLNFGKNQFINSIIGVVIMNGDDTLIGRILGSAALGFYSLGQHFSGIVVSVISGMINGVIFPVLSKVQDNKEIYTKAFFKVFRLTKLFVIPSIGGAIILANEIIILVFGERWLPIVPIFYILSISAFFNSLVGQAGAVLNSLNKPHIVRNKRIINFIIYVVLIYPFIKLWGVIGVCWVMVIFSLVSVIYLYPFLAKEIPGIYSYTFKVLAKIIPSTLLMMGAVYYLKKLIIVNFFWLFVLVIIGIFAYFIPMWFLDKDLKWDLREGWGVIKEKMPFLK